MEDALREFVLRVGYFEERRVDGAADTRERTRPPGDHKSVAVSVVGNGADLRSPEVGDVVPNSGVHQSSQQRQLLRSVPPNAQHMASEKFAFTRLQTEVERLVGRAQLIGSLRQLDESRSDPVFERRVFVVRIARSAPGLPGHQSQRLGTTRRGPVRVRPQNPPGSERVPVRHGRRLGSVTGPDPATDHALTVLLSRELAGKRGFRRGQAGGEVGSVSRGQHFHQPGHKEDVSEPSVQDRRSGKEPVRESLMERKKPHFVAHAPVVCRERLLGPRDRFSRKEDPPYRSVLPSRQLILRSARHRPLLGVEY